ncbi:hypothetical protein TNCV_1220561 [Trichonephila clavipes]|nr:hypothetical protein TNCV_1220561 [Trichonephila clavipes]
MDYLSPVSFPGIQILLKSDDFPGSPLCKCSENLVKISISTCIPRLGAHTLAKSNRQCRYKLNATGSLLPTKDGITVTPSIWLALVREFAAIDQAFDDGKVFVIKDCLLLSRTVIENVTYIICQSYFQQKDFSRKFLTPVSMLKEMECIKRYSKADRVANCFNHVRACFSETAEERSG